MVGEAIYFLALIIKLPLLPSSGVFLQPSQDLLRDKSPYQGSLIKLQVRLSERQACSVGLPVPTCEQGMGGGKAAMEVALIHLFFHSFQF